jgi:hypothetical protein
MLYKKVFAMFIFAVCLSLPVFSAEADAAQSVESAAKKRESVLAVGFEYGFFKGSFFDGTVDVQTYRTSPAINLSFYSIPDKYGVGSFIHSFILGIPNKGTVNGVQPEYTEYFGVQTGFIIGYLRNFVFSEKFSLLFGAGPNLLLTIDECTQAEASFSRNILDLGMGLDWVFSYAISNRLRLFAGCVFTVNFLSFEALDPLNPPDSGIRRIRDFSIFTGGAYRPYVSVGFRL